MERKKKNEAKNEPKSQQTDLYVFVFVISCRSHQGRYQRNKKSVLERWNGKEKQQKWKQQD